MTFDFGAEAQAPTSRKKPNAGSHRAKLCGVIHVGSVQERFGAELKAPCNAVLLMFELKSKSDFEDDGVTPLYINKLVTLKTGSKATLTKIMKALDPEGKASNFSELIDRPCSLTLKASKQVDEQGKPKYINFESAAPLDEDSFDAVDAIALVKNVGEVRYGEMTTEALLELNDYEAQDYIMGKSEKGVVQKSYGITDEGKRVEELVAEIRKQNPEYGVMKKAEGNTEAQESTGTTQPPAQVQPNELDQNAEY